MIRRLLSLFLVVIFSSQCGPDEREDNYIKLFQKIPSDITGIQFNNIVEDGLDFNILSYRNFYNGGGIAIGDINNDGLNDIYFVSNQNQNKLYLNKGNWKFEDITEQAGVGGSKKWCTGVAMADVNNDGFLDIYVCNSADLEGEDRRNELFINNGDLSFSEEAEKRGLASNAFSVHASFFDYDLDGDLDCYLLNNSFTTPEQMIHLSKEARTGGDLGGDRLYQNNEGIFSDVAEISGIHTGDMGFGLGVSVSDLNDDMLPDIYISNDFWERDYLYINQGEGKFKDEAESRIAMTSMNSMGADVGDINNDGYPDIMSTDMLPPDNFRLKTMTQFQPFRMGKMEIDTLFHHQLMQNALQLNSGNAQFQEIAHLANVGSSDWSWGATIIDLDLDGWKDIFISNGIQRDMTDFDFVDIITNREVVDKIVEENNGFDFRDFLPFVPTTKISNKAYINQKDLTFNESASEYGLSEPSFSNGSAYGDLDNDGDLDLVLNNANMECFLYRNNALEVGGNHFIKILFKGSEKNPYGIGAKVIISKGDRIQEMQHFLSRGFQSSVAPGLVFGTASVQTLDTVKVIWPDLKMQILTDVATNQVLTVDHKDANQEWQKPIDITDPLFTEVTQKSIIGDSKHNENQFNDFQQEGLTYKMLSTEGPKLLKGDFNGDQLQDIVLLGASDEPNKLFIQLENGTFKYEFQQAFVYDKHLEATCGVVFDFDQDGDKDVLIGHGGNEIQKGRDNFGLRLYENDGVGHLRLNIEATPPVKGNLSCIEIGDLDKDGDFDLFIGARSVPGNYGLIPSSFLLLNTGNGKWANITTEEFGTLGMVTDAVWSDIDNDEDIDLVVVGDWMPVTIFENVPGMMKRKGVIKDSYGWWSAIEKSDLDNDGDDDYILGNWGLNSKFKASVDRPLSLYVKDFNRNGKVDQILEWYPEADDKAYPFASKDELIKFLPHLEEKIETYKQYGSMTYEDLFDQDQREGALKLKCNTLESAILWRDDKGFRIESLPIEAQISPVFSIVAQDIDQDEITDILLFGNLYGIKPEVGRLDGNRGVLLKGSASGRFENVPFKQSGLFVEGQVRDATIISDVQMNQKLIIAKNNLPLQVFFKKIE